MNQVEKTEEFASSNPVVPTHFTIPFLWGIVWGGSVTVFFWAILIMGMIEGAPVRFAWFILVATFIGLPVCFFAWFKYYLAIDRATRGRKEEWSGPVLPDAPAPMVEMIGRVQGQDGFFQMLRDTFQMHDPERITTWASRVTKGESLAFGKWTGDGKLFAKDEYTRFLQSCKTLNYVRNAGGSAGNILTSEGMSYFTSILQDRDP